jgi:hypothetical protein
MEEPMISFSVVYSVHLAVWNAQAKDIGQQENGAVFVMIALRFGNIAFYATDLCKLPYISQQ